MRVVNFVKLHCLLRDLFTKRKVDRCHASRCSISARTNRLYAGNNAGDETSRMHTGCSRESIVLQNWEVDRRVTVRRVSHGNQQDASSQSWDRVMMAAQFSVRSGQCVRPSASPSFPHFLFLRPSYRRDRRQYVSTLSVRPCVRMSCNAFPTCLPSISSVFISK